MHYRINLNDGGIDPMSNKGCRGGTNSKTAGGTCKSGVHLAGFG